MTIRTDFHAVDKHGTRDFVLQCHKRPFAMTVSPLLPKSPENLIDLELVEFLNIPIKKIEARRFSFAGIETRIVGHVSQTVQCVVNGKIQGTTHLKAAVVRHLTSLYNMDCIAGGKTCQQLLSADNFSVKSRVITCSSDVELSDNSDDDQPVDDEQPVTPSGTPSPIKSSAPNTPSSTPRPKPSSGTTASLPRSPPDSNLLETWCYQGGKSKRFDQTADCPVDKRWQYMEEEEIWTLPYSKSGPDLKPATPDHTVAYIRLGNEDALTSFCNVVTDGWPKVASQKTEPTPTTIYTSIQAIASSKHPCGDCGDQFSECQSRCYQSRRYQHYILGDPPYVVGHTGPDLPPNFTPCGNYCVYEECECLRRYNDRDWAS